MSNLPNWPGAQVCYRRAYHLLTLMSAKHVAIVRGRCVPSDEMNELIDALNRGDEERIKGLIMLHGETYPQIYLTTGEW